MVLANVLSLWNKMDKLQANICHLCEFRDACVLAFTETWLNVTDSDLSVDIKCFGPPIHLDRDCEVMGRTQGGGVCFYITLDGETTSQ